MEGIALLFVLAGVAVLVLALVGFVHVINWLGGAADRRRAFTSPPPTQATASDTLTRAQKLLIVEEVLGDRLPPDLAVEMYRLMPWRYPGSQPSPSMPSSPGPATLKTPAPLLAPTPIVARPAPDPSQVQTPAPSRVDGDGPRPSEGAHQAVATFDLGAFAAPAGLVADAVAIDDAPLAVPAEVAAASARSRAKLKLFFSFENIIFLLAACLILGGTLYLVATTWGRVSSSWQHLYAEALLVFYGWVLLATAQFLRRRLGLHATAAVLAAIAAAMSVGAGALAAAAFAQGAGVGALGTLLAQLLALPAALMLIALHESPPRLALFFGCAVLALAGAGLGFSGQDLALGAWLLAAGAFLSSGLLLWSVSSAHTTFFLASLTPAAGVLLMPATMGLPGAIVAPTLAVLGFACRPARRIVHPVLALPALFILLGLALGLGHASLPWLVGLTAVGLLATLDLASDSPHWLLLLLGVLLSTFLALTWTTVFGFRAWPVALFAQLDFSVVDVAQLPVAALGALPFALAAFIIALVIAGTRPKPLVEGVGYLLVIAALALAAASYPRIRGLAAIAAVAGVLIAYANARAAKGEARLLIAHLLGLVAAFCLGSIASNAAAFAAVGVYGLALLAIRGQSGFWVGVVAVPLLAIAALLAQETRWLPVALLGSYGLLLLRSRSDAVKRTGPLVLPSLVTSLMLALCYAGAGESAWLAGRHFSAALLLVLVPALLWSSRGRAPYYVTVEVLLGLAAAALDGSAVWVLLACLPLLAGREARARQVAAAAFMPLAGLALYQGAGQLPLAPGLAFAGGLCLFWPLAGERAWPRWLGMPGLLAALAVALFHATPAATPWLSAKLAVPLLALGTAPFFAWAVIRRRPDFLVVESVVATVLLAVSGLACSLVCNHGPAPAIVTGIAALSLLLPRNGAKDIEPGVELGFDSVPALIALARWLVIPGFLAALLGTVYCDHAWLDLPGRWAVPLLALGLLPFFAWALVRRRPDFIVLEAVFFTALLAVAGLLGALVYEATAPTALTAGLAALALLVPLGEPVRRARWLGLPLVVAAVATLYLHCYGSSTPPELFPLVMVATSAPFFLAVAWARQPSFLSKELLAFTLLLACGAIIYGLEVEASTVPARAACGAGLAALWMFLGCARKHEPETARVAWVVTPLASAIAFLPLTRAMFHWPAAVAAVVAAAILCTKSRRRRDTVMAAIGLGVGLLAVSWAVAAAAKPFAHGGDPTRHLPKVAMAIAVYGMIMGKVGGRISWASADFLRRLETTTVLLGEAALLIGIALRAEPGLGEVVLVVLAFAVVACAATMLAFRSAQGWPFYIAESALGLAYGYLRLRTGWLDGLRDLDSLVACILAFVNLGIARTLRRWRSGLGAKESEVLGYLLPLLAPLFLQIHAPLRAVGTFAAAAAYAWFAKQRQRPIFGWIAGLLANVGIVPLWLHYDVHSPIAFALPVGTTLMILGRVYRNELGQHGALVRSLASLFVFGATSYQMFQFDSPWPALILAVSAIIVVLLGIVGRARTYLYVGFACLLLDILANLTRWSMGDRLRGAFFGLGTGMVLLALGVLVARHKERLLERYRRMQTWQW